MILVSFESGRIAIKNRAAFKIILMSFESADRAGSIGSIRVKFGEICHHTNWFAMQGLKLEHSREGIGLIYLAVISGINRHRGGLIHFKMMTVFKKNKCKI